MGMLPPREPTGPRFTDTMLATVAWHLCRQGNALYPRLGTAPRIQKERRPEPSVTQLWLKGLGPWQSLAEKWLLDQRRFLVGLSILEGSSRSRRRSARSGSTHTLQARSHPSSNLRSARELPLNGRAVAQGYVGRLRRKLSR